MYEHWGWSDGTPRWNGEPQLVGTKWLFDHIFAGDDGVIYAVTRDGELWRYSSTTAAAYAATGGACSSRSAGVGSSRPSSTAATVSSTPSMPQAICGGSATTPAGDPTAGRLTGASVTVGTSTRCSQAEPAVVEPGSPRSSPGRSPATRVSRPPSALRQRRGRPRWPRRATLFSVRTFRVFLSSTFQDLEPEREAFRVRVVPELRRLCRSHGSDFSAVDLRWGIGREAGLDQRTMEICLAEVRRCLALTPRPNFVILLGRRYGWRPVPSEIPSSLFERLVEAAGRDDRLLRRWYVADTNAVPPRHRLLARAADDDWGATEAELPGALERAAENLPLAHPERVRFGASATEQEIEAGAFSTDPTGRVFTYLCAPEPADAPGSVPRRLRQLPGEAPRRASRAVSGLWRRPGYRPCRAVLRRRAARPGGGHPSRAVRSCLPGRPSA